MLSLLPLLASAALVADPPHACDWCDAANAPREPFKVFANTYYVGTQGLGSILITSKDGHILIDGALPQSAPLIAANIEKLGFDLTDVKLILNSHAHYDHAGGIAVLQRASGAQVAASPEAKRALEAGGPRSNDPQFGFGAAKNDYGAVANVRALKDGETLRIGTLAVTAHFTPGHTPGGTTWTWLACEADNCMSIAYMDSLTPVSAPDFEFTAHSKRLAQFEQSIAKVAALDCGIALAPHPDLVDIDAQLAAAKRAGVDHLPRNLEGCKAYAAVARAKLDKRIAEERAKHAQKTGALGSSP